MSFIRYFSTDLGSRHEKLKYSRNTKKIYSARRFILKNIIFFFKSWKAEFPSSQVNSKTSTLTIALEYPGTRNRVNNSLIIITWLSEIDKIIINYFRDQIKLF